MEFLKDIRKSTFPRQHIKHLEDTSILDVSNLFVRFDSRLALDDVSFQLHHGERVPNWSKDPVLPGKTGEIQVKYDTNRVNPIRKAITVISNADTPTKVLKITGEVKAKVDGTK